MHEVFQFWGNKEKIPGGIYLLRFEVAYQLWLRVGKINNGSPIPFPGGEYLYVGSARGGLAPRLLRHATRSWGLKAHRMRHQLTKAYDRQPPTQKRLHWHIDYLMDQDDIELRSISALHTTERLEKDLAKWAAAQPETSIVVARLGASDHAMGTHLLRVEGEAFWQRVGEWMGEKVAE